MDLFQGEIRDYHKAAKIDISLSKNPITVRGLSDYFNVHHNYTGFDLYVFNLWINEYLKSPDFNERDRNMSLERKITKEYIMENSRLSFDIVYGLIHDDIFPLLGI
jgi:hypothetical protein